MAARPRKRFPECSLGPRATLAHKCGGPYTGRAVAINRNLDPAFASTDDLMAAAGIARRTVSVWVEMGLLPEPQKVSLGMPGGVFNRFPAWAVERARFIAEKRAGGFTNDEVRVMLTEIDAQEARQARSAARPSSAPSRAARSGGRRR